MKTFFLFRILNMISPFWSLAEIHQRGVESVLMSDTFMHEMLLKVRVYNLFSRAWWEFWPFKVGMNCHGWISKSTLLVNYKSSTGCMCGRVSCSKMGFIFFVKNILYFNCMVKSDWICCLEVIITQVKKVFSSKLMIEWSWNMNYIIAVSRKNFNLHSCTCHKNMQISLHENREAFQNETCHSCFTLTNMQAWYVNNYEGEESNAVITHPPLEDAIVKY